MDDGVFTTALLLALPALVFVLYFYERQQRRRGISGVESAISFVTGIGEDLDRIDLDPAYPGICSGCGSTDRGPLFMEYRYLSVLYLFGLVSERRYFRRCPACGHEDEQDRDTVRAQFGRTKVPSNNLLGFGIVFGTLLAILVFGLVMYSD
jgi:hypothetical protein